MRSSGSAQSAHSDAKSKFPDVTDTDPVLCEVQADCTFKPQYGAV